MDYIVKRVYMRVMVDCGTPWLLGHPNTSYLLKISYLYHLH